MKQWDGAHPRVWQSALALKTYFERKIGLGLELLREAPTYALLGDIPLGSDIRARGLWGIRPEAPLDSGLIDEISSTFAEVLQARQRALGRDVDLSNVIALKPRPRKKWEIQRDCLIECASMAEIHKTAFELHSSSPRYAFLSFADLAPVSRSYLPDLLAMGRVSFFVPDVVGLEPAEQKTLCRLMEIRSLERPLVLAGTSRPLASVARDPAIDAEFLAAISAVHVQVATTFARFKAEGLLQYFLDTLSAPRP